MQTAILHLLYFLGRIAYTECIDAAYRFIVTRVSTFRGVCISVCLLDMSLSCAKMAESIEMLYRGVDSGGSRQPCISEGPDLRAGAQPAIGFRRNR